MRKVRKTFAVVACALLTLTGCTSGPGKSGWFSWHMPSFKASDGKNASDKEIEKAATVSDQPRNVEKTHPAANTAVAEPTKAEPSQPAPQLPVSQEKVAAQPSAPKSAPSKSQDASGSGKPAWWQFSWLMPASKPPQTQNPSDKEAEKAMATLGQPRNPAAKTPVVPELGLAQLNKSDNPRPAPQATTTPNPADAGRSTKPAWWQFSWKMPSFALPGSKTAADKELDKSLAVIESPPAPKKSAPLTPKGALTASNRAEPRPSASTSPVAPAATVAAATPTSPAEEKSRALPPVQVAATSNSAGVYEQELQRAETLDRTGQPAAARAIYERLTRDSPSRYEAYHRLGRIAARDSRFQEAEGLYGQALRLNPRNAETLNDLAYAFYCEGKLEQAENTTLRAVAEQPRDPQLRANLGMIYAHQGRPREAVEQLRLAGSEADACVNVATILAARNDRPGAKEYLRRALAADPRNARAKQALEALAAEESPKADNPLRIAKEPSPQPQQKAVR